MRRIAHILFLLLFVPVFSPAQSTQHDWENLKRLRPRQKIEVVETDMAEIHGVFVTVTDEAITLRVGRIEQSIERPKVLRVSVRDTSHRTRNMILGSGIAGGIALAAAAVPMMASSNEGNGCTPCVALIAAGFGGGAALGALPGSRTIYRIKK
jgi:hypothetical protein